MQMVHWGINLNEMLIPGIGILDKIVRPIIIYFIFIIGLRLGGKREMGQITTLDFVVLIMLANAVQNSIIGNDNSLTGGVIGAASLLAINAFTAWLVFNNKWVEKLLMGSADVLISKGEIKFNRLKKERITIEQLTEAAHKQGIALLSEVQSATLDPNGTILFKEKLPSTETKRYSDLVSRMDKLTAQLNEIHELITKKK